MTIHLDPYTSYRLISPDIDQLDSCFGSSLPAGRTAPLYLVFVRAFLYPFTCLVVYGPRRPNPS